MIKILSLILAVGGMIALSPWAMTILGGVFFISGVSMLKYRKDTPVE